MKIILCLLFLVGAAQAETLKGHPRVVDADTLAFGEERVRIEGIDAPETHQKCEDATGATYPCGKDATKALKVRIGSDSVTCKGEGRGRYGRLLGFCAFADGSDLNEWVVLQGHALAYRKYSTRYVEAEAKAKAAKRGIWAGRFVNPWDWRRGKRLD